MVIQCPACQTRFKLADDKVKPEGVKVRCSRCREVFAVSPPEPEVVPPSPPEFPSAEEESGPEAFDMPTDTATARGPEEEPASGAEFGDLNFSEDEPAAPPRGGFSEAGISDQESLSAAGFSGGEEDGEASFGPPDEKDLSFLSDSDRDGDTFSFDESRTGQEGFSFEEDAPDSGLREEPVSESAFGFDDESGSGPEQDFSPEGDGSAFSGSEFSWDTPEESGVSDGFEFDSSDSPEEPEEETDFDFSGMTFGEREPATSDGPLAAAAAAPALDRPEPVQPPPETREEDVAKKAQPSLAEKPKTRGKSPMSGLLVFLLILLVTLSALAGYVFWKGGPEEIARLYGRLVPSNTSTAPAGQIELAGLKGHFVNNPEAGQLFVIQGEAVNRFPQSRSAIAVKGVLYNGEGQPVLQQTVFAGNPLSESELEELSFARIEEKMNNQFGDSLSNLNVGADKTIPFTIVFKDLPPDLAEFTVEVAESRPGSQ